MLKLLKLQFGVSSESVNLEFDPGAITIFVGPNNSGKSLLLKEIEHILTQRNFGINISNKILDSIELNSLSISDVIKIIFPDQQNINWKLVPDEQPITLHLKHSLSNPGNIVNTQWREILNSIESEELTGNYKFFFASVFLLRLDGEKRLSLVHPQKAGDFLSNEYASHLDAIFKNDKARAKISEFIFEAFSRYFVVDPMNRGELRIRLSKRAPIDTAEEQALDIRARNFHKESELIELFSDGVKAFTGILTAIFSGEFKTILIDEPEAFLYPPLARKLGQILTQMANQQKSNVIASTHSTDFILGCVQVGIPVNIVRLTYSEGNATARLFLGEEFQKLMRDPILRSAGVLNALFHYGTVVGEGNIDRVFYEEINLRLLAKDRGVADILFINAISKDTIRRIIKPLRDMGIPSAGIVDLDILKENDLAALLRSAYVPEALVESWSNLKRKIVEAFKNENIDLKTKGIQALNQIDKEVAENLISDIAKYGIFIVPVGEVENWLSHLNIEGQKTKWLIGTLEKLGSNPEDENYIQPSEGDVWEFIENIGKWIKDPKRRGMGVDPR